jgi:LmbE family N-acetylglucosaminyl deacetylase
VAIIWLVLIIPLFWVIGFVAVTDFAVPVKDMRDLASFRRVLVIFPHADDEAVTCAGFLHRLSRHGYAITLVLLTKGERGTPSGTCDAGLKEARMREARRVASLLGLTHCIQEDFGDGTLIEKKRELLAFLGQTITRERPDLLITYDLSGLYGHVDHIACAEVLTDLRRSRFPGVPLWYVTLPSRVLARVRLPAHLATGPVVQRQRASATHRVFIGPSVVAKIRAWYAYKSQRATLTEGIRRFLPIWFFLSMVLFEYFAAASE